MTGLDEYRLLIVATGLPLLVAYLVLQTVVGRHRQARQARADRRRDGGVR